MTWKVAVSGLVPSLMGAASVVVLLLLATVLLSCSASLRAACFGVDAASSFFAFSALGRPAAASAVPLFLFAIFRCDVTRDVVCRDKQWQEQNERISGRNSAV
jgi:hypothetical protein